MFKKLIFVMFTLALFSGNAFSDDEVNFARTVTIVDKNHHEKTVFSWDETPYLYAHFNHETTADQTWTSPEGTAYQFLITDNDANDLDSADKFMLNMLPDWNNRRRTGIWSWFVKAEGGDKDRNGTFTVTPEPISTALFLLGGAALAGRRISKKRKLI